MLDTKESYWIVNVWKNNYDYNQPPCDNNHMKMRIIYFGYLLIKQGRITQAQITIFVIYIPELLLVTPTARF